MRLTLTRILTVKGWAIDVKSQSVSGGVFIVIDGAAYQSLYGVDRPDVAKALALPTCRQSGFECEIPTTTLALGEHVLSLRILTNDQKSYYQSEHLRFRFDAAL